MARINKAEVVFSATHSARRVQFVVEDPAVVKAAKQAGQDVAQAVRSCSTLAGEIQANWARSA